MPFEIKRKSTRQIHVGDVAIGGNAPIAVQSMTNTRTQDVAATVAQVHRLEDAGCEIIRVAVPDEEAAAAIARIKKEITIPLIADIHFDYKLAVLSAESGADALRINPGNIGSHRRIKAVVDSAKANNIPIRIGVNAGSLEKELINKHGGVTVEALVESALNQIDLMASFNFSNIKLAIKSSSVPQSIDAYRQLSAKTDFPLHVGITEAGGLFSGIVKSSIGIGMLLAEGIGDTLRVSLTRDPIEEVRVGFEILKSLGIRQRGPEIISCPTCGRCNIDLFPIAEAVEKALMTRTAPIKVAIMGCVVNGPGEAKEADVGIAGGDGFGILFKKGKVIKKIPQAQLVEELLKAVDEFEKQD
ncbi:MAG: flavodoxin-dependent (E)-4-hydroxy-3-methylbut-2-enyl-diphosphate synthase [Desulfobacteraceae bacterium]|jgi:(E)-4-hydroxy-3-methylbut-2-enyl-diphosphate synthase|nr:flavodoxin-dependent (E)-4-hydroxy-3-methylbut-2-enyl-diphosphate synthase [Desulfobacteraceae bacterium]